MPCKHVGAKGWSAMEYSRSQIPAKLLMGKSTASVVDGKRRKRMQIMLNLQAKGKEAAVAIGFNIHELKFALAVLQGINNVVKADFIQEAITDLTVALAPKALPFINYSHICENCFRDIDERDENTMRNSIKEKGVEIDVKYHCRVCKPINPNRPR